MQITVTGKQLEVTDPLRAHVEQKLAKLERYFQRIGSVDVVASKQRNWFVVELTMTANGYLLRAEERADDVYHAVDRVVSKLELQLKKYKTRLIERPRAGAAAAEAAEAAEAVAAAEPAAGAETGQVVRTKRFAIKPMSPEEAVMEMELLGHDFFVFSNGETEQVNVVYRRKDGNYGLIEPEF